MNNIDGQKLLEDLLLVRLAQKLVELDALLLLVALLGDALGEEDDDHAPEEAPFAVELFDVQLVSARVKYKSV